MIPRNQNGIDIKYSEESVFTYKIIENGDYVIHLRSFQGGFAFSRFNGICSPAYTVLKPNKEILSNGFLENYFTSKKFIDSLRTVTFGIRDGKSISVDQWMTQSLFIPSKNEQEKIIAFIQKINSRIEVQNKIIKHRKSLIFSLVIEILLSFLSLIESALSLNVFSFFNNLLKFMWTIFKEVKRLWSQKKT